MIKKGNAFCMALMASMFVISCQNSSSSTDGDVQYLAVQTESDGKWGMVDGEGKLLFADEFKNEPSAVVNGYFSVREGERYVLYSASAKPEVVPGCDDLTSVGVFKDGIIPVTHEKGRITFVDGKGAVKTTLNPVGGKEIIACSPYAQDGLFVFATEAHMFGYIDKGGKVVIEPKYDEAAPFSEGLAVVKTEKNDETVSLVIDKKGQEVFRVKKDLRLLNEEYKHGLLVAENADEQVGFLNKKGEFTKVSGKVKVIGDYDSDYYAFRNEEYLWGVMNMNGEVLIRPKYGSISFLPDGNFFVKDEDKYYILNKKSDKIQTIEDYSYVVCVNKGKFLYIGRDKSTYVLLDKDGNPIGKEEFKGINYDNSATPGLVTSDYFNFDSVLEALVGGLTANGMDKYTLGMPASKLGIENYDNYVYEYEYRNPELNKEGWRYEVEFGVRTDSSIATREYYNGYDSKVIVNPESKVEAIAVRVNAQVDCWKELKDKLIATIEAKGFKVDEKSDNSVYFNGKDSRIELGSYSSGDTIYINMYASSPSVSLSGPEAVDTVWAEVEAPVAY